MKNLSDLIKGLQLIQETENVYKSIEEIQFNSQESKLFIGDVYIYSESQISELETLGFIINPDFDCFEYDLD